MAVYIVMTFLKRPRPMMESLLVQVQCPVQHTLHSMYGAYLHTHIIHIGQKRYKYNIEAIRYVSKWTEIQYHYIKSIICIYDITSLPTRRISKLPLILHFLTPTLLVWKHSISEHSYSSSHDVFYMQVCIGVHCDVYMCFIYTCM